MNNKKLFITILILTILSIQLIGLSLARMSSQDDLLRLDYAFQLTKIGLKTGNDFKILCGGTDTVNFIVGGTIPKLTDPATICTLNAGNNKAIMIGLSDRPINAKDLLQHLTAYVGNPKDKSLTLTENDYDECSKDSFLSEFSGENPPLKNCVHKNKYKIYAKPSSNSYDILITYDINFKDSFTTEIANFFKRIFNIPTTNEIVESTAKEYFSDIPGFHRGYVAYAKNNFGERFLLAYKNKDKAVFKFNNFTEDVSGIGEDDYELGKNLQVLTFNHMSDQEFIPFVTKININPQKGIPRGSDLRCGDNTLSYGEECDGNLFTLNDDGTTTNNCKYQGYDNDQTISCKSNCVFDTSSCVTCVDGDNDGYVGANRKELRRLDQTPMIGSLYLGSYEVGNVSINLIEPHTGFNTNIQAIPLPITAFFERSTDDTKNLSLNLLNDYVNDSCNDTDCEMDQFNNQTTILSGLVASEILYGGDITPNNPCQFTNNFFSCDKFTPSSFGNLTSYYYLLKVLNNTLDKPIFFIGSNNINNIDEKGLYNLSLLCGALARGVNLVWESFNATNKLGTFVFFNNGAYDQDYDKAYFACMYGIHKTVPGSELYYHTDFNYSLVFNNLLDGKKVDGIVISDPATWGSKLIAYYEQNKFYESDFVRNKINLLSITPTNDFSSVLGAYQNNVKYLLFSNTTNFYDDNQKHVKPKGIFFNKIIANITGKTFGLLRELENPSSSSQTIITDSGNTTIVNGHLDSLLEGDTPIIDTDCLTEEGSYSGYSGVKIYHDETPFCLLKNTDLGKCGDDVKPIDCNDTLSSSNPLADEIPNNNVDDDCDGIIDETTNQETILNDDLVCNYDRKPNDGESKLCSDNERSCSQGCTNNSDCDNYYDLVCSGGNFPSYKCDDIPNAICCSGPDAVCIEGCCVLIHGDDNEPDCRLTPSLCNQLV